MGNRNTLFTTATVEIDQWRYEELIKAEQKAEQYKTFLENDGDFENVIEIIELKKLEKTSNVESEENKDE